MNDGPHDVQPVTRLDPDDCRVLAIIVAYNSPDALTRCLRSLDSQTRPVDAVLVIDNSEPTPLDLSGLDLPLMTRTEVIPAGSNLGPAGGFALGLAGLGWIEAIARDAEDTA